MASNPFFSGRIPQELYDKAVEYCTQQGQSKTDLLIYALSTVLGLPVPIKDNISVPVAEVTKEMFEALEQRVQVLEQSFRSQTSIIITDNEDNDNNDNAYSNSDNVVIKTTQQTISQSEGGNASDNNDDKDIDNTNIELQDIKHEEYIQINTTQISNISNLTRKQIQTILSKVVEQLKQQNKLEEPGCLLKEPVEVFHRNGITVNNYPYKLFYAGENTNEKPLWNLIPDDNKPYQALITEIN